GVADAGGLRRAEAPRAGIAALRAARRAGGVVLGGVGEDGETVLQGLLHIDVHYMFQIPEVNGGWAEAGEGRSVGNATCPLPGPPWPPPRTGHRRGRSPCPPGGEAVAPSGEAAREGDADDDDGGGGDHG